jgi:hypothetical protein
MSTGAHFLAALACLFGGPAPDGEVFTVTTREFKIPLQIAPEQLSQVSQLHLYVSADQGRTWKKTATARPSDEAFTYAAPRDGVYWFTVQVVDRQRRAEPAEPGRDGHVLKIAVDTARRSAPVRTKETTRREEETREKETREAAPPPKSPSLKEEIRAVQEALRSVKALRQDLEKQQGELERRLADLEKLERRRDR